MRLTLCLLAVMAPAPALRAQAPKYTAEGVANSASWQVGYVAPYTFASISGENLADLEKGRNAADANHAGIGSVDVLVNGLRAMVFYVSPKQLNFLIPMTLMPGNVKVKVVNRGTTGPEITVNLREYAPALFQLDPNLVVAQRWPEFAVATPDAPARPGEILILYATGLGGYGLRIDDYTPLRAPLQIAARKDFRLLLDSVPVDEGNILYVGAVDNYWGLYQINLRLPDNAGDDPTIQIAIREQMSLPGIRIPLRKR